MTERKPEVPSGLAPRGLAFWRQVTEQFDLDLTEVELLTEAARAVDECEALHLVVAEQGRTVRGSRGQVVAHPAQSELRQTRLMLGRLSAQREPPDVDGDSLPSPAQVRGRRAAGNRWGERRGSA